MYTEFLEKQNFSDKIVQQLCKKCASEAVRSETVAI